MHIANNRDYLYDFGKNPDDKFQQFCFERYL